MKQERAYGQLIYAVRAGGGPALVRLAGSSGTLGELARSALERATSPGSHMSAAEAVDSLAVKKDEPLKGGGH